MARGRRHAVARGRDTQCGAKAFRREATRKIAGLVRQTTWAFQDLGFPVTWADQFGSRLRGFLTAWQVGRSCAEIPDRHGRPGSGGDARSKPGLRILALNWRCLRHPQTGGAELNLFEQARRWVRDGHEVTVFCGDPGRAVAPSDEVVDGIRVHRRGGRLTVYLHAALFLLRRSADFDCVLDVANGIPFFSVLFNFNKRPVTLLVHHVHDRQWFSEFPFPLAVVGRFLERRVVPFLYRDMPVIAVSPTTRDELIGLGFAASHIQVIYNGVTLPIPPSLDRAPWRGRTVAYVGRLKRYKRIGLLVRLVAELREELPDIRLEIAGDGDLRPELEALVDELDARDYVAIHGFVSDDRKVAILEQAAVFATASMKEGWGLSVLEANAYGCPAVAFDVPGLQVAVRSGVTGLLAADVPSFRRAVALLLQDEPLRQEYAAAARRWAKSFDWDVSAAATLRLLAAGAVIPEGSVLGADNVGTF